MPINPDRVRKIMEAMEGAYPNSIKSQDLANSLKIKPSDFARDPELIYCEQKGWIEISNAKDHPLTEWYATTKGIDAYMQMKKGKKCFEISDP